MRSFGFVLALALALGARAPGSDRSCYERSDGCRQSPYAPLVPPASPLDPGVPFTPSQPPAPPFSQALASAAEGGTQPAGSYMPGFFGDLLGGFIIINVFVPEQDRTVQVRVPTATHASAVKLAESDSPRPVDRFYYLYNFYGGVVTEPTAPLMNVNRHVVGFEKTFWDGDASIGMRLPFFTFNGSPAYATTFTGDLSIIAKYALVNNRQTGNLLSAGLTVSPPTGGAPTLLSVNGPVRAPRSLAVTLQPYVGYIVNPTERLYLHGFHAVAITTDSGAPTFMSNDAGVGYWMYRDFNDSTIRAVVPTLEVHVATPFGHRQAAQVGQFQMIDTVSLTTGVYLLLPRSVLGGALGIPLGTGPNKIEALASYTLRW